MNKPARSKNFLIPLIIYPFDVMVSLNENFDQFAKNVTNKWGREILDDFKKYEHPNQDGVAYVYTSETCLACILKLHKFSNNANGFGSLAHEIFHVSEFVLRKCGLELNSNSHEAYAYLCGYITCEIYKKL